jgi:hypothetical protein
MSGPHLSDAGLGPARQRTVAAWLPRTTPMPWLKAAIETARRASRQLASLASPASRSSPGVRAVASPHACCPNRMLARSKAASPFRSRLSLSERPDRPGRGILLGLGLLFPVG